MSERRTICAGWSVLEIGSGSTATSVAGMMLAENGARVLKVEPPDGVDLRHTCPSGFLVWNRGKESLLADLDRALMRATGLDHLLTDPRYEHAPVSPTAEDAQTPGRIAPSCLRGQHTDGILAELGCTGAEIDALKGAGAVFGPDER